VFDTALSATANKVSLSGFVASQDIIQLDKDVFTALTTVGTLSAAIFNSSATGAASDANDYILSNTQPQAPCCMMPTEPVQALRCSSQP